MAKPILALVLLLTLCLGCNDAATQQKTNQAQQSAVSAELKEQGEAMHNAQTSTPDDTNTQDVKP